jgi:hypothetical protein
MNNVGAPPPAVGNKYSCRLTKVNDSQRQKSVVHGNGVEVASLSQVNSMGKSNFREVLLGRKDKQLKHLCLEPESGGQGSRHPCQGSGLPGGLPESAPGT